MTYVAGNATHLRGRVMSGEPEPGDVYRYDGSEFVSDRGLTQCEEEVSRNTRNIQLLLLQQATYQHIVFGEAVNGFYDSFEDDSGVNRSSLVGQYSAQEGCFVSAEDGGIAKSTYLTTECLDRRDCKGQANLWFQDAGASGHFEGEEASFDAGASTTSEAGGTQTGFPATGHGLVIGDVLRLYGFATPSFNGMHTVQAGTTATKIVLDVAYVQETIGIECKRRKVLRLGAEGDCPDVRVGMVLSATASADCAIVSIDGPTQGAGVGKVLLSGPMPTVSVSGVYDSAVFNGLLTPAYYCMDSCSMANATTPGTRPGARQLFLEIVHPPTRKYYCIAGAQYSDNQYINECWEYDIDTDAWRQFTPSGDIVPFGRHHSAAYISSIKKYLVVSCDIAQNGVYNSTHIVMSWFDPVALSWTNITPLNYPTIYHRSSGAYDPVKDCFWLFGGDTTANGGSGVSNELWCYNIAANAWTQKGTANAPAPRCRMSLIYEHGHGLLMFGGVDGAGVFLSDIWRYDIATDTWTQLNPSGSAPVLANQRHSYEPASGRWYHWGGMSSPSSFNPYVFAYDISTNAWQQLQYEGTLVYGSHCSRSAITPLDGVMYAFAGGMPIPYGNDMRRLTLYRCIAARPRCVATTHADHGVDVSGAWTALASSVSEYLPIDSGVFYALSWDDGLTWQVFSGHGWRDIARFTQGLWQVWTNAGWVAASSNNVFAALLEASGYSENQMTAPQMITISDQDWYDIALYRMPCESVHIAAIMVSGTMTLPAVSGWSFDRKGGLDVRSVEVPLAAATSRAAGSFLVKNPGQGLRCHVSSQSEGQWVELTGLVKVSDLAGGIEYWTADSTNIAQGSAGITLRVRASHPAELHGWAVTWG